MTLAPAPAPVSNRLAPAYALLDRAVTDGAFPGGVLAVGLNGKLAIHPFGKLTRDAKAPLSTARHDLRCRLAHQAHRHHHGDDDSRAAQRPRSRRARLASAAGMERRRKIRSRSFLASARHPADAPASRFRPAGPSRLLQGRERARQPSSSASWPSRSSMNPASISNTPISVSFCSAKLSNASPATRFREFARKEIFDPLGMKDSRFNPPRSLRARIAPTENDQTYRKRSDPRRSPR